MKILLINNGKGWSGGQEHLKDLALELRANGVEVHFLVREETVNVPRFSELGFTVHTMPYKYGLNSIKAFFRLIGTLRREQFDIVSINREHDLLPTVLAYRLAFPLQRKGRLMMSYHLPTVHQQPLLNNVDAVVCISEHVRATVLKQCPKVADKTSIIYYGIKIPPAPDQSKFTMDRARRYFHDRPFPIIGMVGEFWKNQIELVEMLPQLLKAFPTLTLAFIGNNSDRTLVEPLEVRAKELGVTEHVIFTGLVPRDRLNDVFYDMDLSVTTHRNEGFGIVHLESLAAGTPVVGYNEGGYVDLFKNQPVGVMVDGTTPDFGAAVIDLLQDHERRFKMGTVGYQLIAKQYTLSTMGKSYFDFYRQLQGEPA